jgi:subtilase family serine protease
MQKKSPQIFHRGTLLRWHFLAATVLLLVNFHSVWAAGRQQLKGHVPPAIATFPKIRPVEDATKLRLAIGLPIRDPAGLQEFLNEVYNPHNFRYRQYLTPDQFADRFGPSPEDYQAVLQFAQSNNLKVEATYLHRLMLDVSGRAADIAKAFHVHLDYYQRPDGSLFYAPDREPSVDLDVPLLHVSGLENFHRPWPKLRRGLRGRAKGGTAPVSTCDGCFQGKDFRDAYVPNVPATVNGAGQSVALLEFDGFFQSDISTYESSSNPSFSAPTPVTILVDGATGTPSSEGVTNGNDDEVSLDIEMVVSMAPGAQVVVYEVPPNIFNFGTQAAYDAAADDMLSTMASNRTCYQISSSWGGYGDSNTGNILKLLAAQGQAYFEAVGDEGSFVSNGFPGDSCLGPNDSVTDDTSLYQSIYETLVGGTGLSTSSPSGSPPVITYSSETTWNDAALIDAYRPDDFCGPGYPTENAAGGGGICTSVLNIPSYQTPVPMGTNGGSTQWRNMPDVSMVAYNVYLVSEERGYEGPEEGTSCASPLWAAYWALGNQESLGQHQEFLGSANPVLYPIGLASDYSSDFHDISDGSDNFFYWPTPGPYKAVSGYDLATGWGSPNGGQNLINDLMAGLPTFTPTPTPTATYTPCGWPGNTCTFTPTFTPTPTSTPTSTATPTPTAGPVFLAQACPNVTDGREPIQFVVNLTSPAVITLSVYDLAGEQVYSTTSPGPLGWTIISWPVVNQQGSSLASGLYLYYLQAGGSHKLGKICVRH